jgi:hypothetical protein
MKKLLQLRQGDVQIQQISKLPQGCTEVPPEGNRIVLAHGEVTGHAHAIYDHQISHALDVVAGDATVRSERAKEMAGAIIARVQTKGRLWAAPDGARYLEVTEPVTLRHEEHTQHTLPPGIYHLPTQVEYTPAELRRVMIERYGAERYVVDSGATVVHELPIDHPLQGLRSARLLRKDVPDDEPIIYVDLLNSTPEPDGTTRRYMLRIDPNAYDGEASRNVHAAAASTWRNADGSVTYRNWRDYAPAAES